MIAACAATPPAPPVLAETPPVPVDLSPGTSDLDDAGQVTPGTDPARDLAGPPVRGRPRNFDQVNARAGLADFFELDRAEASPGWFAAQATPWLPAVAAGRLGSGAAASVGVLAFDWCADRPTEVSRGASVRLPGHDASPSPRSSISLREPGGIPLQPRAPLFTTPAGGCTRMPALVVRASDADADAESVLLVSLTGDGGEHWSRSRWSLASPARRWTST